MASGRCRSCGADLPSRARFCPRCGAGSDEIPILPLVDVADPAPEPDDLDDRGSGSKVARTVAALVVGLIVVFVGLSALSGGDDEPSEEAAEEDDSAGRSTSSTTTARSGNSTSTTVVPLIAEGHPAAAGVAVFYISNGELVVADLGTGRQIEVEGPPDDAQELALQGSHLMAVSTGGAMYSLDLGGDASWSRIEADPLIGSRLGLSGGPLLSVGDWTAAAIDEDGALGLWELPGGATPWSAQGRIGEEIVITSLDGVFLVTRDGSARRISPGIAVGTNGREILVVTCDDALLCRPATVDAQGAVLATHPPLPDGFRVEGGTISPDGSHTLISGTQNDLGGTQQVLRVEGGSWVGASQASGWLISRAAWVPDTGIAVWWSPDSMSLAVVPPQGESSTVRLARGGMTWGSVAVSTIDALPEEWRAELTG